MKTPVKFLNAEHVVEMHEELLERWGGESGGGHRGVSYEGADAAVQAVKNSYYDTLKELAAAYAVYIVQGHVFMDGNKRTAAAALATFMVMNGKIPKISTSDLRRVMIEMQARAENGEDPEKLIRWISSML